MGINMLDIFPVGIKLLSMIFGQLTGRDSLRDLMISIEPHKPKYYHLGFGKGTSRSNFANANEKRDCRIFEEYAFLSDRSWQENLPL